MYGDADFHQLRLAFFEAHTLALQYDGDWSACNRPFTKPYGHQACGMLSSCDPLQQIPSDKIEVPEGWIVGRDIVPSPDRERLYVGYDTRFPDRDIFTDVIVVYDTARWEQLAALTLPAPVTHFALSTTGDQLFIISPFTRSLAIYDTDTFQDPVVMRDLGEFPSLIWVPGAAEK